MEYAGYRLSFRQGVHFGSTTVESAEMTFGADRLFSALCQEAVSAGEDELAELYGLAEKGALLLSDAFPYLGAEYYLPKPLLRIQAKGRETDARERKKYKKLSYVPLEEFDAFVAGEADIDAMGRQEFGERTVKTSVNLWGEEATPYRIGTYNFSVENDGGLYILVGWQDKKTKFLLEELLDMLSFSGLGGRRSSGLGRFELHKADLPKAFLERLEAETGFYMNLSVALPKDEEMSEALEGARYLLAKRSGFIASERYADEPHRKRDIYAFQAGSCFRKKFCGQIADVSAPFGKHPVYRYLKPIWMGIRP